MTFRRGFKTWAEQTSARIRQKLRIASTAGLDLRAVAALLSVIVLSPEELPSLPEDVRNRLLTDHEENWSAITVTDGNAHLVVINSSHPPARVNSSLAHELSHVILGHEPSFMFMNAGCRAALRTHNEEQEEEANWLSGALLLPREVLLHIRRQRWNDETACHEYGVSLAMLRYRFNVTGVDKQLGKYSKKRQLH